VSDDIPQADHFEVCFCGGCPNAHVLFFDEHDRLIMQAVLSAGQAEKIAREIRKRDPNFREIGGDQ
jgi:hypothetical protein